MKSTHGLAPEHKPRGNPCRLCKLPAKRHRRRERKRTDYMRDYRHAHGVKPRNRFFNGDAKIIGIDGEGCTRKGVHRYVYLAASTKHELVSELHDPNGLSTSAILTWVLSLPKDARKVVFAGEYDKTHWFKDLSDMAIHRLWRPELRDEGDGPKPIFPRGGFAVNMLATRLSVRLRKVKSRTQTIWDVFKFPSTSFVAALETFGVGTKKERRAIERMKKKRGKFRTIGEKERAYCQWETRLLAELAEKIELDLKEAGLTLHDWFGSGSIASAMLQKSNAQAERAIIFNRDTGVTTFPNGKIVPAPMLDAVRRAFFGGRFEISECGPIANLHRYDIANAYAYAESQLPCLKHGHWELVQGTHDHVLRAVRSARAACVHYELADHPSIETEDVIMRGHVLELAKMELEGKAPKVPSSETLRVSKKAWGPFPFRLSDGAILFPVTSAGGWIWHPELLTAIAHPELWPNIRVREAWVLRSRCKCPPPFLEEIAGYYIQRLKWGKGGKGLMMKRGLAARSGKRSQGVGASPYQDLVTAGLINAFTRAQVLEGLARAPEPWNVVSVSTDGLLSRVPLRLASPAKTGTENAAKMASKREGERRYPLGGWEHTHFPEGFHLIRPGMRFALGKNDMRTTAARGLGIRVLHEARKHVLRAWEKAPKQPLDVERPAIFHGAKLTVSFSEETGYRRSPLYGQWTKPEPWKVSYEPLPKRPCFEGNRLLTWALGIEHGESAPYDPKKTEKDPAIVELRKQQDEADAQPDGGIDTMGEEA